MVERMPVLYKFEFDLTPTLERYHERALMNIIKNKVGIQPIAVTKHFKQRKIYIILEREPTEEEKKKLVEILSNPPKLYVAVVRRETPEEIRARIAAKLGVEPLGVVVGSNEVREIKIDKPVDLSKLTDDDLKVKYKIDIKPALRS